MFLTKNNSFSFKYSFFNKHLINVLTNGEDIIQNFFCFYVRWSRTFTPASTKKYRLRNTGYKFNRRKISGELCSTGLRVLFGWIRDQQPCCSTYSYLKNYRYRQTLDNHIVFWITMIDCSDEHLRTQSDSNNF